MCITAHAVTASATERPPLFATGVSWPHTVHAVCQQEVKGCFRYTPTHPAGPPPFLTWQPNGTMLCLCHLSPPPHCACLPTGRHLPPPLAAASAEAVDAADKPTIPSPPPGTGAVPAAGASAAAAAAASAGL